MKITPTWMLSFVLLGCLLGSFPLLAQDSDSLAIASVRDVYVTNGDYAVIWVLLTDDVESDSWGQYAVYNRANHQVILLPERIYDVRLTESNSVVYSIANGTREPDNIHVNLLTLQRTAITHQELGELPLVLDVQNDLRIFFNHSANAGSEAFLFVTRTSETTTTTDLVAVMYETFVTSMAHWDNHIVFTGDGVLYLQTPDRFVKNIPFEITENGFLTGGDEGASGYQTNIDGLPRWISLTPPRAIDLTNAEVLTLP